MIPAKLTIHELFEKTLQYVVPLYQRSYVWTREGQWEPLWEDIEDKAAAISRGERPMPHFLGAVVLNQIQVFGNEVFKKQVIDGQQRLTTLQLFLAALRDHIESATKAASDEGVREQLSDLLHSVSSLTRNRGVMARPEVERYKVWPTNFDRQCFTAVISATSMTKVNEQYPIVRLPRRRTPEPGPLLVEAYRFFSDKIGAFVRADGATGAVGKHPLMFLYEAIRQSLHLVVIELEQDDDPQVIFETLNARGVPLLASDLIRNHLFGRAVAQGDDADALYQQYWVHYDERAVDGRDGFWKRKVKQGRLLRPRFDNFFQHYLACRSESDVSPAHLFQHFRAWWEQVPRERSVRDELIELQRFSKAFRTFHEPASLTGTDGRLGQFLGRLRVLDTSTLYPLLLFLLVEAAERLSRADRDGMLTDLESYLIRSWICGLPSKNYNKIFNGILKDLRRMPALARSALQSRLLAVTGDNAWPDDAQFERAWVREPIYGRIESAGVQMVLGAIHDHMLTSKQEKITIAGPLSVEHVMPQNWRQHWSAPAQTAAMGGADETPEERRSILLHSFGNLTLLTQPLNSSVSDGPFQTKRAEYVKQGLLRFHSYFQSVQDWNEDEIVRRGLSLFAHAKILWPYPTAAAREVG